MNAHTAAVDGLPGIKIGDFEMSGAPEIISILESVSNFDGELGLTEIYDRYPKTKMFQHGAGKELFSKVEMLNKYRIQFPDYPDQAVKGNSKKLYPEYSYCTEEYIFPTFVFEGSLRLYFT